MTIIVLYLLSVILLFIKIKLFTIIAIFLGLCYFPCLSIFAIGKKEQLFFEDLILCFALSIGVSSLLTLGVLYAGIHIKFILYIIYAITGFCIFSNVVFKDKTSSYLKIILSRKEIIFLIFVFFVTLLFSIPIISERISISAHGFHHASIAVQILNGIFPPENPGMGGTDLSYQWGYHAFVAALSYPANLHPLRVFSVLNILSLFFIFCIAYRVAKIFDFSDGYCYLVPLALIGLMRSDAVIFFLPKLVAGTFPVVETDVSPPLKILTSWVLGVPYLDTRLFFMNKFYNANSMPLGTCLVFSYFLILILLSDKGLIKNRRIYMVTLTFILIAAAFIYSLFLIIPILHMPIWTVFIYLTNTDNHRGKLKEIWELLFPCIIAAILTSPYLIFLSTGETINIGRTSSDALILELYKIQVLKNLFVFWLVLPPIIGGIGFALKRLGFSRKMFFILGGAAVCLILTDFLRLPWYDNYKFSFILSLFFALLFVFFLTGFVSLLPRQWIKKITIASSVALLSITPLITETAYIYSPWFNDDTYTFSGNHILFKEEKERNDAYSWIRDNTPKNSLILLPFLSLPYPYWDSVANNNTYRTSAISERAFFVIKDVYAWTTKGYNERVKIRENIFRNPADSNLIDYLNSLHRPIYLLIEDGYTDSFLRGVENDEITEDFETNFLLVFHNDKQRIYSITFSK